MLPQGDVRTILISGEKWSGAPGLHFRGFNKERGTVKKWSREKRERRESRPKKKNEKKPSIPRVHARAHLRAFPYQRSLCKRVRPRLISASKKEGERGEQDRGGDDSLLLSFSASAFSSRQRKEKKRKETLFLSFYTLSLSLSLCCSTIRETSPSAR